MAIDFQIENKGHYLLVTCHGPFEGTGLLAVHEKALRQAVDEGASAILVDTTALEPHAPSTWTRFSFAAAVAQLQKDAETRVHVAFVGKPPLVDPRRFGETVALNRGASAAVFECTDDAASWIDTLPIVER